MCLRTNLLYSEYEFFLDYVQHDQVKVELIKQKVVPLLVRCVVESQFDPFKVQLIALEVLLALSFDNNAYDILKKNEVLLGSIRLLVDSNNPDRLYVQRAAERLLWRLGKEEAISQSPVSNMHTYDIMISYSHKDEQICFRIHEQLKKDGYRVWIDRDCLRGFTMVGIAHAIENSESVLICMSNTYKQSVYCQSEAHYAFEQGCRLIPIIIEPDYKPDGWLGIIVSGKIYVNFTAIEFAMAYEKLRTEISDKRRQDHNHPSIKLKQKNNENIQLAVDLAM